MPHVIVKFYKGRTPDVKLQLAKKIVKDVMEATGCEEKVVSVAIEEFDPAEWPEKVYKPECRTGAAPQLLVVAQPSF